MTPNHWIAVFFVFYADVQETTTNSYSSHTLREIVLNSSAPPRNRAATSGRDSSANRSSYLMAGAVAGMFTGVTFNNSAVNISINFQSNETPKSDSLQWKKNS